LTVNSNAGNEALAMGCPVLCVGPALYAMAGVAMLTHLVNLAGRIAWMRDCRFDEAAVKNYLYHLACRQWTGEELAEGTALKGLLDAADAG
jgi:capsule polysaccharide modification protein KpsS